MARLHDGRLRRGVHVHGRHAAQLGRVVPRQRFLQAVPQAERDRAALRDGRSRIATVFLFLASIGVTSQLASVEQAWKFLLALGAGTGLVLILRWYWWRINAWSRDQRDGRVVRRLGDRVPARFHGDSPRAIPNADATIMLVTVAVSTVVWVAVTFLTQPGARQRFSSRSTGACGRRPGLAPDPSGRLRRAKAIRAARSPGPTGSPASSRCTATLFGIGKMIFGETMQALIMLAVAAAAFLWIARSFRQDEGPAERPSR